MSAPRVLLQWSDMATYTINFTDSTELVLSALNMALA